MTVEERCRDDGEAVETAEELRSLAARTENQSALG